jgi:hypothetical protein
VPDKQTLLSRSWASQQEASMGQTLLYLWIQTPPFINFKTQIIRRIVLAFSRKETLL